MKTATRLAAAALVIASSTGITLGSAALAQVAPQGSPQMAPARPAVPQTAPQEGLTTGRMPVQKLDPKGGLYLTDQQRVFIRDSVMKEKDKVKPPKIAVKAAAGGALPPSLELYHLPDPVVAEVPNAKLYRYTIIEGRVVLADPTKMQIIEVLDP